MLTYTSRNPHTNELCIKFAHDRTWVFAHARMTAFIKLIVMAVAATKDEGEAGLASALEVISTHLQIWGVPSQVKFTLNRLIVRRERCLASEYRADLALETRVLTEIYRLAERKVYALE